MLETLIPPWFVPNVPTCNDLAIVSVIWGISLGLTLFGALRAGDQTFHRWKRTQRATAYMALIWLELIASTVMGGLGWGYVRQSILPSFEFFFILVILWCLQIHCIMQIIINRITLLAISQTIARRLRWGVFVMLALVNISVFCIWIPARLQISQRYIHINNIWDRIEKGICAVIDLGLNLYFIYLVRSSLIAYGLTKYVKLYRFNIVMVGISMTMDILIIAMMSLKNTFLYVLFHPLAYLVKLHIELSMASLIAKIVKASSSSGSCHCACHQRNYNIDYGISHTNSSAPSQPAKIFRWWQMLWDPKHSEGSGSGGRRGSGDLEMTIMSSSTRQLRQGMERTSRFMICSDEN